MVKESGLGIISVIFSLSCVISVFAQEQFTITTYYPSPYGSYRELTTTGNTYLATTSGSVGIKTTSPERDVHIANGDGLLITSGVDANTTYLILTGVSPASTYAEIFAWDNNFGARNLAINPGGGNVGIGTVSPQSTLHVPDGKYAQFEDNNAGAPPAADCDSDRERGRISIDRVNYRLYICMGRSRGWDFEDLSD